MNTTREGEMASTGSSNDIFTGQSDHDAVVVGASLAGCTTAMLLARAGARVALVEKSPDPAAFKRICSHFIQASGVPVFERLGLLDQVEAAGAVRSHFHAWTRWGWIGAPKDEAGLCLNLRRSVLDPLMREAAGAEPGVELILGRSAERLLWDGETIAGVVVRDRDGHETRLRAPLTVGADGRDSRIAELSGVPVKTRPHGRIAYGGYFEGATPPLAPDTAMWMLDPDWVAAFPTDSGLTFYAAMPTKDRLPDFKRDPEAALVKLVGDAPEAPPIREGRAIEPVLGKVDMLNRARRQTAPGLALVGDAALAIDPIFGVGCGWALQSGEWLADAVAPALAGSEPLGPALERYRKRHTRELRWHAFMIHDYSSGRKLTPPEKALFKAAVNDPAVAAAFDRVGTRRSQPLRELARIFPRLVADSRRPVAA
ncbi:MAG TPA: NAD(P)/FAD-dependent oxidoreductase [Solirubrobacterales bacterium]|nr:NAD(P)/FAD-dependent oxidoreductase [Solirubrobacterales bacterium]